MNDTVIQYEYDEEIGYLRHTVSSGLLELFLEFELDYPTNEGTLAAILETIETKPFDTSIAMQEEQNEYNRIAAERTQDETLAEEQV